MLNIEDMYSSYNIYVFKKLSRCLHTHTHTFTHTHWYSYRHLLQTH